MILREAMRAPSWLQFVWDPNARAAEVSTDSMSGLWVSNLNDLKDGSSQKWEV